MSVSLTNAKSVKRKVPRINRLHVAVRDGITSVLQETLMTLVVEYRWLATGSTLSFALDSTSGKERNRECVKSPQTSSYVVLMVSVLLEESPALLPKTYQHRHVLPPHTYLSIQPPTTHSRPRSHTSHLRSVQRHLAREPRRSLLRLHLHNKPHISKSLPNQPSHASPKPILVHHIDSTLNYLMG